MPKFSKNSDFQRFQYSKQDCDLVIGFLKSNQFDVGKAFECVWTDPLFENLPREAAPSVFNLVEGINRLGSPGGFEKLWELACQSEKIVESEVT